MSYIAGSSAVIVTEGLSDLYIFNSETDVTYGHEPYVRSLGISANNQTFANLVISSGGTVTNSKTTVKNQLNTFSNVEVHNGGLLSGMTGGVISSATIHSGGSFVNAGFTLRGVTVSSGATITNLFTGATNIYGDVRVESGAKVMTGNTDLKAYTDADGWWHNMTLTGALHLRGAKALDPVINSWLYLSAGAAISGGTNAKGKGGTIVYTGASAVDFTLSSALVFDLNYTGATLGGTQADLTATPIYICNGAFTSAAADSDPNLTITNGVITGMTLVDNGVNHLRAITLTEGIRVNDAVVSSGGTLSLIQEAVAYNPVISDGGYAMVWQDAQMHNATVQSGGNLNITSGGSLFGGTIQAGGSLTIHHSSYLSNTTIESGAYSLASNFGEVYNVQVAAGAKFEIKANVVFAGKETNIAQGAIYYDGAYSESMRVENGVLYGLNNEGLALHIRSGFAVSGGTFRGYIHASGGTLINGVDFVKANGLIVSSGGVGENVIINSGAEVRLYEGSLLSNAIISSGGNLRFYNVDATVRGGVLSAGAATWTMTSGSLIEDMEIHAAVKVSTGATFSGGLIGLGGTVSVGQGGNVFGTVVSGTNGVQVFNLYDPNASGTIQGRARISGSDIDIRQGIAVLRGSNVYVDNVRVSGGVVHLQNDGHFTNFTIYGGGEVQCYANDTNGSIGGIPVEAWTDMHLDHVVMSGGSLLVSYFGNVSDITMYAGKMTVRRSANRNSGGYLEGLTQSGGTVDVHSTGIVSGATLVGAAYMTADTGAVLNDFTLSSGANLLVSGATLTNATFYDSTWTIFSNATVSNVDMMFTSGGRVIFSNGVKADGIRVSATKNDLTVLSLCGTAEANDVTLYNAYVYLSGGGKVTNAVLSGGALIARGKGGVYENTIVRGGDFTMQNGGSAFHTVVSGGMMSVGDRPNLTNPAGTDSYAEDIDLLAGSARVSSGGTVSAVRVSGGATLNLISGAAFDATAFANGNVYISGGATLNNGDIREGATVKFVEHAAKAMLQGAGTDIAVGTLYYNGATTALGASVESGIVKNLGADGQTYRLSFGDDIIVKEALVNDNCRISGFGGAVLSGVTVAGKTAAASVILTENATAYDTVLNGSNGKTTLLAISANATAYDTVVNSGGTLRFNGHTAKAVGTVVNSGGILEYNATTGTGFGSIEDTVVKAGGTLTLSDTADTGANLTLDFTGAGAGAKTIVNDLALVSDTTTVYVKGAEQAAGTYTLGDAGTLDTVTQKWGLYENALANGGTYDDALNGLTYAFNGTAVTATALSITTGAAAGLTGDNYTTLRTADRAAKWTGATDNATLVTENFAGDAFLTVAGDAAKAIYGAGVDYEGTVNINAKSGTIRNLAAGAEAGKTVGAVKLTFDGATLDGTGYAGGFGSVTGATETLVAQGSFAKDFYAGALANKNAEATSVGDVNLTVDGGTFAGNLYGASAVKTAATVGDGIRHTAGDVSLTLAGGAATNTSFCAFAGGYATGDAAGTVYTVTSVTVDISGGNWGTAHGGRGIFGGVFASQVGAEAGDVAISISGGTMGNVYGGGWAQKNGTSTVGDVAISISGGTVANVFGGGSHSTSGGTTEAGDVTITVSGGDISGAIYARGQLDGDTVASAEVIFTGANDYACNVYGYSYVGAADASDATLTFAGYRGTFAGEIGGFDSIEFNDGTVMTLATAAADVANSTWKFDVAGRDETLADTAMLNWSAADFSGDTIALNLATGQSAEWTLVDAATDTNYHQFDVLVDGVSQGTLALDDQLASGDFAGWGFTLEDSALKFKNLA